MNRVLENLRPVGALDERIEAGADFALACAAHFMVMDFNVNALLFKQRAHFRAHVGKGIDGRDGEVAALDAVMVAEVAAFRLETGRQGPSSLSISKKLLPMRCSQRTLSKMKNSGSGPK